MAVNQETYMRAFLIEHDAILSAALKLYAEYMLDKSESPGVSKLAAESFGHVADEANDVKDQLADLLEVIGNG